MSEQLDTAADAVMPDQISPMANEAELKAVKDRLAAQTAERIAATKRYSRRQIVARRFWRNKTAVFGLIGLTIILLAALFGSYLAGWDYLQRDRGHYLEGPSAEHWFGTDKRGRDMFAMTMEGLRKSLIIGFSVALIQTGWAAIFGASAAYFGGWVDKFATWFIDLMLVIPSFLMIAIISNRFGAESAGIPIFILLLAAFGWVLTSRVVRSLTMSVKNLDYVHAAKYMSVPSRTIIVRHILPNISSLLIIDFTLGVASAVLSETSLSYFGFGIKDPQVSLGSLIGAGQASALTHPWLFLPPAFVLVIMLASVNFIGDGMRDALDPSSKSGGGKA
ncbi:ABC transporter permease [Trueperella pyogenes]|uniref:Oligopeptide transport system permease protein OppC n=2 Tax=Trueperella pyogenes TaxID=1661 RepID=A0ABV3N8T5_9ACTO|nr:ABC transporter permease [Trueperella pyogenes]AJC69115.1 peptide ABC transporter permease [Trueperella pyogenes TP8]MCI7690328.1 ABC transporter permease [Trueperella pyogenes]MDF2421070.1 ABC transporter permease [Trueperella pyogenes]UVJ55331.1 ABC transporter permease [Trueperella pyogenes]UVJ57373.1 ABC transporter permease [Trueperella pyogenes]